MFSSCGNIVWNYRENEFVSCLRSSTVFNPFLVFVSSAYGKLLVLLNNTQSNPTNSTHVNNCVLYLSPIGLSLLSTPPINTKKRF